MADIQVQLMKVSPLEALPSMELVPPILICQSYWVLNLQTLKIQLTWSVQNHVLPLPPQPLHHPQIVPTLQLLHANPTSRIAWQGRALSRCCCICFLFSSFCLFDFFCFAWLLCMTATTLFNFRSCSAHNFKNSGKIFIFILFIMIHSAVNYEQKL